MQWSGDSTLDGCISPERFKISYLCIDAVKCRICTGVNQSLTKPSLVNKALYGYLLQLFQQTAAGKCDIHVGYLPLEVTRAEVYLITLHIKQFSL